MRIIRSEWLTCRWGSSNPIADRIELLPRDWCFDFAIGNSDAHLQDHALLYNERTDRRLTPMYDVICDRLLIGYALCHCFAQAPGLISMRRDLLDCA